MSRKTSSTCCVQGLAPSGPMFISSTNCLRGKHPTLTKKLQSREGANGQAVRLEKDQPMRSV